MSLYQKGIIPQTRLARVRDLRLSGRNGRLLRLDNLVTLFSFELEYHNQLADYEKAVARIEELSGVDLTNQNGSKGE
jgi:hypothetical protein